MQKSKHETIKRRVSHQAVSGVISQILLSVLCSFTGANVSGVPRAPHPWRIPVPSTKSHPPSPPSFQCSQISKRSTAMKPSAVTSCSASSRSTRTRLIQPNRSFAATITSQTTQKQSFSCRKTHRNSHRCVHPACVV